MLSLYHNKIPISSRNGDFIEKFAVLSCKAMDEIKGEFQVVHRAVILHEMRGTSDLAHTLLHFKHAAELLFSRCVMQTDYKEK